MLRNVLLILFGALVLAIGMSALAKFLTSRTQIGYRAWLGILVIRAPSQTSGHSLSSCYHRPHKVFAVLEAREQDTKDMKNDQDHGQIGQHFMHMLEPF